jgi:predicted dehydrogenase
MTFKNGARLGIGIIGCGSISLQYMRNASLFGEVELVGCADLSAELAKTRASEYGIEAMSVDKLLANPRIDLILNLTVPAAHFDVSMSALSADKHVFTEKPLATNMSNGRSLVQEAGARGLLIGCAPDTFLGAAGRCARRLVDEGAIGKPVAGTAFMFGRGMEHWHPNPQFYYQPGAGPVFDMGPYYLTMLVSLLGPVRSVMALATKGQEERLITAEGPNRNTIFKVGTPTTLLSLLEFANGASVTFGASWDVFRHSNAPIELHGTDGSLRLPDPDTFGGEVSLSSRGNDWVHFDTRKDRYGAINYPFAAPDRANYRMLGVADLARALRDGRQPRASGALAVHVLEIMESILQAGESHAAVAIASEVERPSPLSEEEAGQFLAANS